jgi:hypothetical protein
LTLEDDVARLLHKEAQRSGASFKEVVNRFLRLGLSKSKAVPRKPFVVTPRNMGLPAGMNYDNIGELLEKLEGLTHR